MKKRNVGAGWLALSVLAVGLGAGISWLRPGELPAPPRAGVSAPPVVVTKAVETPERAVAGAPKAEPPPEVKRESARLAMEQLEALADLPGARPLVQDIRRALEENPEAIDLTAITEPDGTLRPDYLERMIPDPELREKWIALLDTALEAAGEKR